MVLVTEDFWYQGDFVSRSLGMSGLPKARLPHPVSGTGEHSITAIAESVVGDILDLFKND